LIKATKVGALISVWVIYRILQILFWGNFKRRYFKELDKKKDLVNKNLKQFKGIITLLYAAKDDKHNNAQALKEYIEAK
jgi:uncharacterized protein YeaO (DUF488 family)